MELRTIADIVILVSGVIIAVKTIKGTLFQKTDKQVQNINERLDSIIDDMNDLKKITFALLQHEVTGDHINDMKKLYQEINEKLFQ